MHRFPVRRSVAAALVVAALAAPAPAAAQQFTMDPDVECSEDGGFSFRGPFVFELGEDPCGSVDDGGEDAFDTFGVPVGFRRFAVTRRTEIFQDMNLVRFYDTYTNTTSESIRALLGLGGNLGSDSDSRVRRFNDDYIVTADADPTDPNPEEDFSGGDPVLAFVFGNNAFSRMNFAADFTNEAELFMGGPLTLAPGQSVSLLFFAFLAYDEGRDTREEQLADEELAIRRAEELVANPYLAGLSNEQRLRVTNFDVTLAAVPEPGTWAMLAAGLLAIGGVARTRRRGG